jgi:hypothetical protein
MLALKKQERLSIYKKMLEYYKKETLDTYMGFCYTVDCVTRPRLYDINMFPELMKYKPKTPYGAYWWSIMKKQGLTKRIAILEEIIKEMSKKNK